MTAAEAEGVQKQDLGGQAGQVEAALVGGLNSHRPCDQHHDDQHGQGDDVGGVAARQPFQPEPRQGHLAAGDARPIGLGQDEA
ncbi:hypothetical protein D3C72_1690210 [compost metagenome]